MHIGVIGAMKEETARLVDDMHDVTVSSIGGRANTPGIERLYYTGTLYDRDATVVFSRWGKVAAASTVTTLIDRFQANFVVFTGVAGALNAALNIGDVVIGDEFVQYDMDARPLFNRYEIPIPELGLHLSSVHAVPEVVRLAVKSAERFVANASRDLSSEVLATFEISKPKVRSGLIVSGDRFIASSDATEQLRADLPYAQCVEMEGAAVAQVCWERDVPLAVVRVISDKADHSATCDFSQFVNGVASRFTAGVVRDLIGRI